MEKARMEFDAAIDAGALKMDAASIDKKWLYGAAQCDGKASESAMVGWAPRLGASPNRRTRSPAVQ